MKYSTVRYLLALAVQFDLKINHLDITTAYLNSELEEDIYVNPPAELKTKNSDSKVWKLRKAVYGLKQSGRAWNKKLDTTLKEFGCQRSNSDPCVYIKRKDNVVIIVAVYVDDMLVLSNDHESEEALKKNLEANFETRDLGEVKEFLGMHIERNEKCGDCM